MYLAVDIGGSKTLLAVFDSHGNVKESLKFETPVSYDDFSKALADSVDKLSTKSFAGACVAVPGKIDRKTGVGIAFGNLTWQNVPILQDVKQILDCPIHIENDARAAALSEALLLKSEYRKVLYVTISTGIGGGLIIDGKIDPSFEDMEVGQLLLEYEGKLMDWEDFGSGRAFNNKFGKRVSEVSADDSAAWYWFARNIAIGLIDLIATLTPEIIVLGGGAGAHLEKFQDRLNEELKIYENPLLTIPPIRKAQRSEEAVIYGCFELARKAHAKAA